MIRRLNKSGHRSSTLVYDQLTHNGDPIDAYTVTLPVLIEDLSNGMITSHVFKTFEEAEENYHMAKEIGVNLYYGNIKVYVSELSMPELYNIIRQDVLSSHNDR